MKYVLKEMSMYTFGYDFIGNVAHGHSISRTNLGLVWAGSSLLYFLKGKVNHGVSGRPQI